MRFSLQATRIHIIVALLFLTISTVFAAEDPISIVPTTTLPSLTSRNIIAETQYVLVNNLSQTISGINILPQAKGGIFTQINSTCTGDLLPYHQCIWRGEFFATELGENTAYLKVNYWGTNYTYIQKTLTSDSASGGYFSFFENGRLIKTLDLHSNSSGNIKLVNTGGATITSFKLSIPDSIKAYFNTSECTQFSQLPMGGDCEIRYTIPSIPVSGIFSLKASGYDVKNSPATLTLYIATPRKGHIVFRDKSSNDIHSLTLTPNDHTQINIVNAGAVTLSNLTVNIPTTIKDIVGGTCFSSKQLKSGESCTLTFTISDKPAAGTYSVSINADDNDNNPSKLAITILGAGVGHFSIHDTTDNNVISSLTLRPDDTGTLQLRNTGGRDISEFVLEKNSELKDYLSGSCFQPNEILKSGTSCTIDYAIPNAIDSISTSAGITAKGDHADNSPKSLAITIISGGNGKFAYIDSNGNPLTKLELNKGDSGTIRIRNIGGTQISLDNTISSGINDAFSGCALAAHATWGLGPGYDCNITYNIISSIQTGDYEIKAFDPEDPSIPELTLNVTIK